MVQKIMKAFAPAKLNLALHVTGQREDGYHLLESLVVFAEFGDEIEIQISEKDELTIRGAFAAELDPAAPNLVSKAVQIFKIRSSISQSFKASLTKNLPIASGIGGGSADAAATLIAMAKLTNGPNDNNLLEMGKSLGADVPMCIYSQTLVAKGIGAEITLLDGFPSFHILLVNPLVEVSTPKIFAHLSEKNNPPLTALLEDEFQDAIIDWLKNQRNDLQAPAIECEPIIATVIDEINKSDAQLSRMSGSGATCFGIYPSQEACEQARLQILQNHPNWWVVATRTKEFGRDRATY